MAFALSIVMLTEAMKKPGCPVCRLEHEVAIHSLDSFLWESTNDPGARKPINDAYGFCPEHTRMLVAVEMSNSGPLLGVNIIYELLSKNVSRDLKNIKRTESKNQEGQSFFEKLGFRIDTSQKPVILKPKEQCPICDQMDQSGRNILSTLCQMITDKDEKIIEVYRQSDGLCLRHLRIGLQDFMMEHPFAADILINDAVQRLNTQQVQMLEYIRKHNWAYREEKLTPEEGIAWLRTLTFFTGYPADKFNHKIDEF